MGKHETWTASEERTLARLRSPHDIQAFLDRLPYSSDPIYRCPRDVLRDRKAHCVDGALLAAAALERLGHAPRLVWIVAENDDGHLIALWRRVGLLGAIAKSNFVGLRFREPVYHSLRELVMSYFSEYFNTRGDLSMRAYTRPLSLARFRSLPWRTDSSCLPVIIDDALDRQPTVHVAPRAAIARLHRVDARTLAGAMHGANHAGLFKPRAT